MQISGPDSKGTVGIDFFVNKQGKIDNVFIFKSCEWSADLEAMRVIKSSPDWIPAQQNGEKVVYRHRQSITFQVGY